MLIARVESLDEIAPELRSHYVRTEKGMYELQVDGGSVLKHWKGRARELEAKLIEAQTAAPTPPETPRDKFFREQAVRLKNLTEGSPEYKAEIEAILEMPEAKAFTDAALADNQAKREGEIAHLTAEVERITTEAAAKRISGALAKEGSAQLLLPHITPRLRTKWENDECQVFVVDEAGKEISEDALQIEFREFKPEFAAVVRGASQEDKLAHAKRVAETLGISKTTGRQITRAEFDAMDSTARMNAMRNGAQVVDH